MVLNHEEQAYLRRIVLTNFPHSATRKTATLGAEDAYGNKERVVSAEGTWFLCAFEPEGSREVTDLGAVLRDKPEINVAATEVLVVGDVVTDITARDTLRVVDAGPFEVRQRIPKTGRINGIDCVYLERVTRGTL